MKYKPLGSHGFTHIELVIAVVVIVAIAIIGARIQSFSSAATATVTTSTGVVTHGAIATSTNTVGWLLDCTPSHTLADDPIVRPGQPGTSHLHNFWGNASTNAFSTLASQESLANIARADQYNGSKVAAGTSCNVGAYTPGTAGDTASYWAPVLYANGSPITPSTKAELYYRAKPTFGTGFVPIPQDARLVVGSHNATSISTNDALVNNHIYWECSGNSSKHYQLPPTTCKSILLNVVYPSCYDNKPMDHTGPFRNDNAHFAYAVNGRCPTNFPQKVPQLSEKYKYVLPGTSMNLQLSADAGGSLEPTYTVHADFWNTWQPAALQYLVDKCINAQISCGTNPITPVGK